MTPDFPRRPWPAWLFLAVALAAALIVVCGRHPRVNAEAPSAVPAAPAPAPAANAVRP